MELDRLRHIGANMAGVLTCEDGTRWHPVELLPLANEVEAMCQQFAAFQSAVEHVTEDGKTRRSFVAMPEGWAMVHKDRLHDLEVAEEQLTAALAACKVKDEQLSLLLEWCVCKDSKFYGPAEEALAIQPDDSALRAWLGEPVGYQLPFTKQMVISTRVGIPLPGWIHLYAPKGLK